MTPEFKNGTGHRTRRIADLEAGFEFVLASAA